MKSVWKRIGNVLAYVLHPILVVLIRRTVRTRILVVAENKILVLQQWLGNNKWSLPGGGVRRGEPPELGAIRELHEETGIIVAPEKLQFMYKTDFIDGSVRFPYYCYLLHFPSLPDVRYRRGELVGAEWIEADRLTEDAASLDTLAAVKYWTDETNMLV